METKTVLHEAGRPTITALTKRIVELESECAELRARAKLFDISTNSEGWLTMQAASKALGYGPVRFFELLRLEGILLRKDNCPRQEMIERGLLKAVHSTFRDRETGKDRPHVRPFISPKGLEYIAKRLEARAANPAVEQGPQDA